MPKPIACAPFSPLRGPGVYSVLYLDRLRRKHPFKVGKAENLHKRITQHKRHGALIVLRVWPIAAAPPPRLAPGRKLRLKLGKLEREALAVIRAHAVSVAPGRRSERFAVADVKNAMRRLDRWAGERGLKNAGPRLIWERRQIDSLFVVADRISV